MSRRTRLAGFAVALAAVIAAGCNGGPTLAPVTGRVVFRNGQPVMSGVIEFAPVAGGPAARSAIAKDGYFDLATNGRRGAVAGEHRIVIVQTAMADGHPKHVRRHSEYQIAHPKYRKFETGGLARVVELVRANEFAIQIDADR